MKKELWHFTGPARVFDSEEEALAGLGNGQIKKGEVIVIRYEGPKGGPGMREMAMFRVALKFAGMGETNYIVTDGRFSGYSDGPSIGYLSPEAADGGNIALVQDGDMIEIDIENRKLELKVSDQELKQRRERLIPPPRNSPGGTWTPTPAGSSPQRRKGRWWGSPGNEKKREISSIPGPAGPCIPRIPEGEGATVQLH